MSDMQAQINEAELSAKKELDMKIEQLLQKEVEAQKKAKNIKDDAISSADRLFIERKNTLEERLEKEKKEAIEKIDKELLDSSGKEDLIKKGVLFLLSKIA